MVLQLRLILNPYLCWCMDNVISIKTQIGEWLSIFLSSTNSFCWTGTLHLQSEQGWCECEITWRVKLFKIVGQFPWHVLVLNRGEEKQFPYWGGKYRSPWLKGMFWCQDNTALVLNKKVQEVKAVRWKCTQTDIMVTIRTSLHVRSSIGKSQICSKGGKNGFRSTESTRLRSQGDTQEVLKVHMEV